MRKDKEEAIKLRSEGKSYNEIVALLGMSKSTLSAWLKELEWSQEIAKKLGERAREKTNVVIREVQKIRSGHLNELYKQAEIEAKEEFEQLKYHPLFITGVMIYWGEGDKLSRHRISVANTEPGMLRVFVYFLKNICGVSNNKIRAWILAYPDIDLQSAKTYWIEKTGLKEENFRKTIVIQGKHTKRKLQYGVCTIEVGSTYFKIKMLVWLRCFAEELISDKYYAGVV